MCQTGKNPLGEVEKTDAVTQPSERPVDIWGSVKPFQMTEQSISKCVRVAAPFLNNLGMFLRDQCSELSIVLPDPCLAQSS